MPDSDALRELMRSEQQFRSLFEYHPDALAVHDMGGRFVRVNTAMIRLTGYTPEELIGLTPAMLSRTEWRDAERLRAGIARGEAVAFDREIYTKSNERLDIHGLAVPLFVDGAIYGFCGIIRDVTEDRRRERESARAGRRIGDLYRIAAASMPVEEKVRSALDLARTELEASWANVARFAGEVMVLTHVSGDAREGYRVGDEFPVEKSIASRVAQAGDVFVCEDLSQAPFHADLDDERTAWQSYVGVPLIVEGESQGVIGFITRTKTLRLTASDRDYVHAIGTLVSSAVQQGLREKRLDALAFHDALTGLPNRALLLDRLERALFTARRNGRSLAVHYVDIDRFKEINDSYGHSVGDGALIAVAAWLKSTLRESDTVARIGGDEFVVLQPEIDSEQQAADVANRLVAIRDRPLHVGTSEVPVRLSVGIAVYRPDAGTPVDMLRAADAALYKVKNGGRDGYAITVVP